METLMTEFQFTPSYLIVGALAWALHLFKKIKSNTDGPFLKNKDNLWYIVGSLLLSTLGMCWPEAGATIGVIEPKTWAVMVCYGGGSIVGGILDAKAGSEARKAKA